jgi:phosphate starvation-inducible membrane PsiE
MYLYSILLAISDYGRVLAFELIAIITLYFTCEAHFIIRRVISLFQTT